jgi:hypothetical protein
MNYSNMSFDKFKKFCDAVYSLEPNAKFSVDKGTNTLTWTSGSQPSDSAIETEMARLDTLYTNQAYQRTRAAAYKDIKEQLDQLYHDMTAGKLDATGEWHKAIKAVKDANPKP